MPKRVFMAQDPAETFEIGEQALLMMPIARNRLRVETPPGGVVVRGVRLEAADLYVRNQAGEWESFGEPPNSRSPMTVRRLDVRQDATPAQRKVVSSLFRQAAIAFGEAHPDRLAKAGVVSGNNAVYLADVELAKAGKAYQDALDVRAKAMEAERMDLHEAAAYAGAPGLGR